MMDRYKGDRSDSDSGTPRDDRFFTPRMSARLGGSSSDGESWATPRSTVGPGWLSDEGEYATPREYAVSHGQHDPSYQYPRHADDMRGQPHHSDIRNQGYQQQHYVPHHHQQQQYVPPPSSYAAPANQNNPWIPDSKQTDYRDTQHNDYKNQSSEYWDTQNDYTQNIQNNGSADYYGGGSMDSSQPKESEDLHRAIDDIFSYARHNRVEEVEQLLDRGVPVNVRDQFGNTILTISCQNGNKRVAKAALRRGADINAKNLKGNTALHFCYAYGYGDTLGLYLINKGADPTILNNAGLSCSEGTT